MSKFFPEGLTPNQIQVLNQYCKQVSTLPLDAILHRSKEHLERVTIEQQVNPFINISLAEAIYDVFLKIAREWEALPNHARPWCAGMMQYFSTPDDDEDDFSSPIGFEDDVEIVNACLRLAGRDELCIVPENIPDKNPPPRAVKRKTTGAPSKITLTSGMRVLCRDAEWLITKIDHVGYSDTKGTDKLEFAVHCVGVDDLVRGHAAVFLTQLDEIIPVDPRDTKIVKDTSNGYNQHGYP